MHLFCRSLYVKNDNTFVHDQSILGSPVAILLGSTLTFHGKFEVWSHVDSVCFHSRTNRGLIEHLTLDPPYCNSIPHSVALFSSKPVSQGDDEKSTGKWQSRCAVSKPSNYEQPPKNGNAQPVRLYMCGRGVGGRRGFAIKTRPRATGTGPESWVGKH